jgi:hypothetical protein
LLRHSFLKCQGPLFCCSVNFLLKIFNNSSLGTRIRDILFGKNCVKQDIKKAFELASVCGHPSAVWLTKLFAERDVSTKEQAREVFLGCENDLRARSFAGVFGGRDDARQAADLGDAFAQAHMAGAWGQGESFQWAEKSAAQGERDGFFLIGIYYLSGIGCEKSSQSAGENFFFAYQLGSVTRWSFGQVLAWRGRSSTIFFSWKSCCCKWGSALLLGWNE